MYTSTEIGLGQQVINKESEQRVLTQLLNSGLRISSVIDDRKIDIYLSPDMAKLPYIPESSAETQKYRMLSEDKRKKVTDTVDRVFKEATGISRKLDPKNPRDKPWIRTWLRLRDYIMRLGAKTTDVQGNLLMKFPPFRTSLGSLPKIGVEPWTFGIGADSCKTPPVSAGGYGTALHQQVTRCSDMVVQLLRRSATFMGMVKLLDGAYLAWDTIPNHKTNWWTDWGANNMGVLTRGPFKGKRVLKVFDSPRHHPGSSFLPVGSLGNDYGYDIMYIETPNSHASSHRFNAEYIARIAHETLHAYDLLQQRGPHAKTIPERVKKLIDDEAKTRRREAEILAEIMTTSVGRPLREGRPVREVIAEITGSTDIWQIQRDFFPGALKQTYLEHFVFSELALEAIRREQLQVDDIKRIDEEVDRLEIGYKASQSIKTGYGQWRHLLRGIDLNWRNLIKRLGGLTDNTNPEKERLLQLHASRFNSLAQYDPNPRIP